jgi:hypothetical protein
VEGVEKWLKSAVMATVLVVWALYMIAGLVMWIIGRGDFPNPAIWGVPGGVWLALNPLQLFGKKEESPK